MTISYGGKRYPLRKIGLLEYNSMWSENTGLPSWFIYHAQQLRVFFTPDQAYDYLLYYTKKYEDLSADSDTNDFTAYAERLIENKTIAECYINYRSDPDMAALYEGKAESEFKRLVKQTSDRLATGELVTDDILGRIRYE
jgi:hypothetical protein